MQPPNRDQSHIGLEEPTIDCSQGDTARQEFAQEADINYMLSRFGVTAPRGAPTYGEIDYTLDLQQAIDSVREARAGYETLPVELRRKFPSMERMLAAIDDGSLVIKDEEPPPDGPTPQQLEDQRLAALQRDIDLINARKPRQ